MNASAKSLTLQITLLGFCSSASGLLIADEPNTERAPSTQFTQSVPASIISLKNALVSAEIAANVDVIHVEVGDTVKKGDKLAQLDCREYDAKLAQASANVATVEAQLLSAKSVIESRSSDVESSQANEALLEAQVKAERSGIELAKARFLAAQSRVKADTAKCQLANIELQRSRNLRQQRLISQQDLDQALTEYQAAQAECDAVQSALIGVQSDIATTQAKTDAAIAKVKAQQSMTRAAKSNLDAAKTDISAIEARLAANQAALTTEQIMVSRCTLLAPFDGQIVHRTIQQGQRVGPGERTFQLISVSDAEITAALSKHELDSLNAASEAYFQTTGEQHKVSIRSVVGMVTGQARTREVRLTFNEPNRLPIGLNGRVSW